MLSSLLLFAIPGICLISQNLTGVYSITPRQIALIAGNANTTTSNKSPFQIYYDSFGPILGEYPSLSLVYEADFPAFHEAGVVVSVDPLVIYSSSNQFNTSVPAPASNNKTIVVSRTSQDRETGQWQSDIVWNDDYPLILANGGFPYQDGILWAAQGNTEVAYSAGLVYQQLNPTNSPKTNTTLLTILNNYLGIPLNSPNDIYVSRTGTIFFTDPPIGFAQSIRPQPRLSSQVYAFQPSTGVIKVVADGFAAPNGIQLSPDERTAYITDTQPPITGFDDLSATRTIYAFDVVYQKEPSAGNNGSIETHIINDHNNQSSTSTCPPTTLSIPSFTNRRTFAVPSVGLPDGIKCDAKGNVWVGCGDGLNVFAPSGVLLGKVLIDGGVAQFGFADRGRLLALNEKRLWLINVDENVEPAVRVGEKRG